MTSTELNLDLLDNALDYVCFGIEQFFDLGNQEPRRHKYALLHLFSGTLLLLKEKLRREHPSLILLSVTDIDKESPKTIDFNQAIERIQKICSVELSSDQRNLLYWCQAKRNSLEHYNCNINLHESQKRIGELVEFVDWFMSQHLQVDLRDKVSDQIWVEISELQAIAKRVEDQETAAWRQHAQKYFTLTDQELLEFAKGEPFHPKHNPDPRELEECPQCLEQSLACVDTEVAVCTNLDCRGVFMLRKCPRCGNRTLSRTICDDCASDFERYMERD